MLIEVYHTVATSFDVDPAYDPVANPIKEGMVLGLNGTTGFASIPSSTIRPLGVAGDSKSTSNGFTGYGANIVVSKNGDTRGTSNRVSDFFDETLASGKVTVYMGAGEFLSDQFDTARTYVPGEILYSTTAGRLTNSSGGAGVLGTQKVGFVLSAPTEYPSGVPGVENPWSSTEGSLTVNTDPANTGASVGRLLRFALAL